MTRNNYRTTDTFVLAGLALVVVAVAIFSLLSPLAGAPGDLAEIAPPPSSDTLGVPALPPPLQPLAGTSPHVSTQAAAGVSLPPADVTSRVVTPPATRRPQGALHPVAIALQVPACWGLSARRAVANWYVVQVSIEGQRRRGGPWTPLHAGAVNNAAPCDEIEIYNPDTFPLTDTPCACVPDGAEDCHLVRWVEVECGG